MNLGPKDDDMSDILERTETVNGQLWHWAEAGAGDPVVLLHGIPESWECWKHQIPTLATQFKVYAFDLKGYGGSEKRDGDYTMHGVAAELIRALDHIGIERFRLAGHDWGVAIGDQIVNQIADRVERYVRCCLSLHEYDPRNSLHHQWNALNPDSATRLMAKADAYVRVWFDSSCKPGLRPEEAEIAEIAAAFSEPGIAEAVPRYFRDIPQSRAVDLAKFTMPILYVHGEHDPRQPIEYCRGMEDHLPGLEAILLLDCGHFVTRERPREMTQAMMWFFNSMLGSGVSLFDRSRHHGLPTKPVRPLEMAWGVNAARGTSGSESS
jgi:pimeloyl-ACP methyl ester carboxylesterase